MRLYNRKEHEIVNIDYITNEGGMLYVDKISEKRLNALGYLMIDEDTKPYNKYYDFTKAKTVRNNRCYIFYEKELKDIDEIKNRALIDLTTTFYVYLTNLEVNTGLGFDVDGTKEDLENYKMGQKHGIGTIKDSNNNIHTIKKEDYESIINKIEQNIMNLMRIKWYKEDKINSFTTVEEIIKYENEVIDSETTRNNILTWDLTQGV